MNAVVNFPSLPKYNFSETEENLLEIYNREKIITDNISGITNHLKTYSISSIDKIKNRFDEFQFCKKIETLVSKICNFIFKYFNRIISKYRERKNKLIERKKQKTIEQIKIQKNIKNTDFFINHLQDILNNNKQTDILDPITRRIIGDDLSKLEENQENLTELNLRKHLEPEQSKNFLSSRRVDEAVRELRQKREHGTQKRLKDLENDLALLESFDQKIGCGREIEKYKREIKASIDILDEIVSLNETINRAKKLLYSQT